MCKISQHSWTRQQGFGIDICVRRTQNAETDLAIQYDQSYVGHAANVCAFFDHLRPLSFSYSI